MSKQITSQVLGQLTQDENLDDWWKIENITIPFFDNKQIQITFMDCGPEADIEFIVEADEALRSFLNLTMANRNSYSEIVHKNCTDTLDELGYDTVSPELANLTNPNDIWRFVNPSGIYVTRRHRRDMNIYISVSCSCNWEEEHGLQLVFRQGKKMTRISGHDGHVTEADAYDRPDEEDELLSKF
jgi:hypothetical protein